MYPLYIVINKFQNNKIKTRFKIYHPRLGKKKHFL